jgi:hypothetical protein
MPDYPAHTAPGSCVKGVPETNIKTIARGAAFIGSVLLLYTIASGFSLRSAELVEASAMQQHSVVGVVGTALCIAAIVLLLRLKQ